MEQILHPEELSFHRTIILHATELPVHLTFLQHYLMQLLLVQLAHVGHLKGERKKAIMVEVINVYT